MQKYKAGFDLKVCHSTKDRHIQSCKHLTDPFLEEICGKLVI